MDNYLTVYVIREKGTDMYLPMSVAHRNNYKAVKTSSNQMPRFFARVRQAKRALASWAYYNLREQTDFDIVPVYVTISRLNVEDIAELDEADKNIKQRIRDLGLVHLKGGK